MTGRLALRLGTAALVVAALPGCTTALRAPRTLVFVSPQEELVATPVTATQGEGLLVLENRGSTDATLALAHLDPGVTRLPTIDGVVPIGDAEDLTYRGDGYRIVVKSDELRRSIAGRPTAKQTLHPYLRSGTLVVFDTARGRYEDGAFVVIEVG